MLLLFTPFGFVPTSELSPFSIIVTGKPLANRVIPESVHPWLKRFARISLSKGNL